VVQRRPIYWCALSVNKHVPVWHNSMPHATQANVFYKEMFAATRLSDSTNSASKKSMHVLRRNNRARIHAMSRQSKSTAIRRSHNGHQHSKHSPQPDSCPRCKQSEDINFFAICLSEFNLAIWRARNLCNFENAKPDPFKILFTYKSALKTRILSDFSSLTRLL
jgi:hypothetical protein